MATDHDAEREVSALRTEPRAASAATVDATSALRDRLRLRLTVNNVVPGQPPTPDELLRQESGERVWNSVLESLSTGLHAQNPQPSSGTPAPFPQQPFNPSSFSPQPVGHPHAAAPAHAQPSAHVAGGQIYVPAGVVEYPDATGQVALLANSPQPPPGASYAAVPPSIVAPNIGGTGVPYLGQPVRQASQPRVVASRVHDNAPTVSHARRKKRHPFRAFFSLLVVLSLLAGAGFTGWYFLIKNKVTWTQDVTPLATFVEETAHAKFSDNVPVTTLSIPEYEVKLGIDVLAHSYIDPDGSFGTLRAVGLVSQVPSPSEIGHIAAVAITAFYNPTDKTIYRLDGSTPAFDLAMVRALSVALADQKTQWSKDVATLTDAQQVGVRATVDGFAAQVVSAKLKLDPQLEGLVAYEVQARAASLGIADDARPTYLTAVLGSYNFGAHTSPAPSIDSPLEGVFVPESDAQLFDPARGSHSATAAVTSPVPGSVARTMGMQFWYLVLLPTLGAVDARAAALNWTGDSAVTTTIDGHSCLTANVATAGPDQQIALSALLGRWAAGRPASSAALITNMAGNVITVSACEPSEPTTQVVGPGDATLLYTAALKEQTVGADLIRLGLTATQGAWSCAIAAYRYGALPNFVEGSTDPIQIEAMSGVLAYCKNS